jgi:hypothetical protein
VAPVGPLLLLLVVVVLLLLLLRLCWPAGRSLASLRSKNPAISDMLLLLVLGVLLGMLLLLMHCIPIAVACAARNLLLLVAVMLLLLAVCKLRLGPCRCCACGTARPPPHRLACVCCLSPRASCCCCVCKRHSCRLQCCVVRLLGNSAPAACHTYGAYASTCVGTCIRQALAQGHTCI